MTMMMILIIAFYKPYLLFYFNLKKKEAKKQIKIFQTKLTK